MKNMLIKSLMLLFLFTSCNKDDEQTINPIDQLPPATQTGAQTFGCLIDGEPFVPPIFGGNAPSAFYQFVDGAYTLGISAGRGGGTSLEYIIFGGIDVEAVMETSYPLKSEGSGNFSAIYNFENGNSNTITETTTDDNPGNLTITHLDESIGIVSGTFEFTVIDNSGNQIIITEGRFDLNYTN